MKRLIVLVAISAAVGSTLAPCIGAEEKKTPQQKIAESKEVGWLEKVAGPSELRTGSKPGHRAKDLSTAAYARLGELATTESLAAVERMERHARKRPVTPATVSLNIWIHPSWHFSDSKPNLLSRTETPDEITYALVRASLLGGQDLFLISNKTPDDIDSWSRPRLVPLRIPRSIRDPLLQAKDKDTLIFSFIQQVAGPRGTVRGAKAPAERPPSTARQTWKLSIGNIVRDTDNDGWTDIEEERLGLDPNKADTDGDGIRDGMDCCPDFAAPKTLVPDEDAEIIQRAVFATFGLTGSRHLLLVGSRSEKVQLWGYPGPIIYNADLAEWHKVHPRGMVVVNWRIKKKTENEAQVYITDREGGMAGGNQTVYLRKLKERWFVVKRRTGGIK